jgi:hypothetical protein
MPSHHAMSLLHAACQAAGPGKGGRSSDGEARRFEPCVFRSDKTYFCHLKLQHGVPHLFNRDAEMLNALYPDNPVAQKSQHCDLILHIFHGHPSLCLSSQRATVGIL